MFLIVNYSKDKINVILSTLYSVSIAAIVVTSESQRGTSRLFRAGAPSGFEGVVKIILSALGATLDQPFFTLLRLHGDQANYFRSVSACACLIDPVGYPCGIGGI